MRAFSCARLAVLASALLATLSVHRARAVPDARTLVSAPLPFPAQPHQFQLSDALFAANEPVLQTLGRTSAAAAALAHANDTTATAAQSSTRLGDVPFPTGAFWTNLVLEQGESTVTTLPYAFRLVRDRVLVSYPFRVVMPKIIQNGFLTELTVGSASAAGVTAPLTHRVVAFDAFSATVRYTRDARDEFTLFLVRGSPYVTLEYAASVPVLTSGDGVSIVRLKKLQDQILMNGDAVDFAVFTLMLSNGHTWSLYASDPALELTLAAGTITATAPFTGTLRIALSLTSDVQPYLLESAPVYAVGGAVDYTVDPATDVAHVQFQWKTRAFGARTDRRAKLLMLALPHHRATFARDAATSSSVNVVVDELQFTSIKGMMRGVLGDVWHLDEPLPDVAWDFAPDGLFQRNATEDAAQRDAMRARAVEAITAQLAHDADAFPALAVDSYNFGKQIGREARLLLIADRFEQRAVADKLLHKLERELRAWLTATNADALVYDETFGGVVTRDGMRDPGADYGNGQYNDHHFHYGYMVYALAVVRKFDAAFIEAHAVACALLMGDIGAPVLDSTPFMDARVPVAQLFPVARHKDWFVGHSYASGLFSMEVGKSQESSSEGVNAYYALALFASLDANAQDADAYYHYARLLLATELRSTKTYWHMQPHSTIYEPVFAQNTMVGVAGEMSVVYSTWFGDKAVYVHGINMIPFTPITAELLDEAYVATEFALLEQDYRDLDAHDIWRSAIVLDHAILDAAAAWDDLTTSITAYDTWNSATNSMYWIATRPSWFAQKTRATLTHPDAHDELQCFGYPACSTAGANGTALGCCATLPGCCPSALGCCPPKDPSRVPLNACFGEHACAVLGLGCCNSIDGCCEPDPVTGTVLGCCTNQHPATTTPRVATTANVTGVCFGEPKCAAAKLDCCTSPTGCCAGDGPKLDCCARPPTRASNAHQVAGRETCQRQPQCAAAKLDCCATAAGCCQPDPVTGNKLLCCQDDVGEDEDTSPTASASAPTPSVPDYVHSCHGEVACLTGGANGTALDCCFSEKGCCPGLLCCAVNDDSDDSDDAKRVKTASGDDANDEASAVNLVFAIILGVFVLGTIAFCLTMCYRRRHYAPIDHDLRAWYCAAMVVVVIGFFFFLVASA